MKIKTVEIKNIQGGYLRDSVEGLRHIKAAPSLSVVQSVRGIYEIGLNGGAMQKTEEMGAFVAPSGVRQEILHHNGNDGVMEAQWVFMNITVNGSFEFEDLFDLPLLIPAAYGDRLYDSIRTVIDTSSLCRRYAAGYEIADLLFELSAPKEAVADQSVLLVKRYVEEHYRERITKEDLAAAAHCSTAGVYRLFRRHFRMSPSHYINKFRLAKASAMLERKDRPVGEVSSAVGFDDPVYFSKLFKECYGVSPRAYRDSFRIYARESVDSVKRDDFKGKTKG